MSRPWPPPTVSIDAVGYVHARGPRHGAHSLSSTVPSVKPSLDNDGPPPPADSQCSPVLLDETELLDTSFADGTLKAYNHTIATPTHAASMSC